MPAKLAGLLEASFRWLWTCLAARQSPRNLANRIGNGSPAMRMILFAFCCVGPTASLLSGQTQDQTVAEAGTSTSILVTSKGFSKIGNALTELHARAVALDEIRRLLPDWMRHLEAKNRTEPTRSSYLAAGNALAAFLVEQGICSVVTRP